VPGVHFEQGSGFLAPMRFGVAVAHGLEPPHLFVVEAELITFGHGLLLSRPFYHLYLTCAYSMSFILLMS
jgi:hypothetical protein